MMYRNLIVKGSGPDLGSPTGRYKDCAGGTDCSALAPIVDVQDLGDGLVLEPFARVPRVDAALAATWVGFSPASPRSASDRPSSRPRKVIISSSVPRAASRSTRRRLPTARRASLRSRRWYGRPPVRVGVSLHRRQIGPGLASRRQRSARCPRRPWLQACQNTTGRCTAHRTTVRHHRLAGVREPSSRSAASSGLAGSGRSVRRCSMSSTTAARRSVPHRHPGRCPCPRRAGSARS